MRVSLLPPLCRCRARGDPPCGPSRDDVPASGRLRVLHHGLHDSPTWAARSRSRTCPRRPAGGGRCRSSSARARRRSLRAACSSATWPRTRCRRRRSSRGRRRRFAAASSRRSSLRCGPRRVRPRGAEVRPAVGVDARDRRRWCISRVVGCPAVQSYPSSMPTTSTPSSRARIVTAAMTLLMPGAGRVRRPGSRVSCGGSCAPPPCERGRGQGFRRARRPVREAGRAPRESPACSAATSAGFHCARSARANEVLSTAVVEARDGQEVRAAARLDLHRIPGGRSA